MEVTLLPELEVCTISYTPCSFKMNQVLAPRCSRWGSKYILFFINHLNAFFHMGSGGWVTGLNLSRKCAKCINSVQRRVFPVGVLVWVPVYLYVGLTKQDLLDSVSHG